MTILALGTVALDTTRTPFRTVERVLGGSLSYFALSAQFFHRVAGVSVVGTDFPKSYREFLSKWDVDWTGMVTQEGKTFHFDSEFDASLYHRKTLKTDLGVIGKYEPVVPASFRTAEYVYLGTFSPPVQLSVLDQMQKRPKLVICDTIEYLIENDLQGVDEVLSRVDGVVFNDAESRQYSGESNLVKAAYAIAAIIKMPPIINLVGMVRDPWRGSAI